MNPADTSIRTRPQARPINDPALARQLCSRQPRVSLEEMQRSVLAGINSARSRKNAPSK